MPLSRKHILKNSATLLRLGVSAEDVERTSAFVEAHLPKGADPDTWIPSEADLSDGYVTETTVLDARTSSYRSKSVPRRLRRILDATLEA